MKKKLFQKKNFLGQILKLLLLFFIRLYKENYQKIFFGFLPSFDPKYLKNDFWAYVMRQALFLWPGLSKFVRIRLKMIAMT